MNVPITLSVSISSYEVVSFTTVVTELDSESKSDLFLLKTSEFSFISHDSILKLNDIRSISTKRILYKHNGRIDVSTDTYKTISNLVFQKYFGDYYYELQKCKEKISELNKEIESLKSENTL